MVGFFYLENDGGVFFILKMIVGVFFVSPKFWRYNVRYERSAKRKRSWKSRSNTLMTIFIDGPKPRTPFILLSIYISKPLSSFNNM